MGVLACAFTALPLGGACVQEVEEGGSHYATAPGVHPKLCVSIATGSKNIFMTHTPPFSASTSQGGRGVPGHHPSPNSAMINHK